MNKQTKTRYVAFASILCITISLAGATILAQKKPVEHVKVPVIAASNLDVSTIEGIVKASYETISGPVGAPRQWGRDRTLFASSVRYLALHNDAKSEKVSVRDSNYQDYLDESDPFLVKEGFTEVELGRVVKQFGNVATVLSSYEGRVQSTGKVVTRGVNIFSLYNDGQRWWIQTMLWDEERPGNPIPAELLPKN